VNNENNILSADGKTVKKAFWRTDSKSVITIRGRNDGANLLNIYSNFVL